jgi:hypothetical protein
VANHGQSLVLGKNEEATAAKNEEYMKHEHDDIWYWQTIYLTFLKFSSFSLVLLIQVAHLMTVGNQGVISHR